MAEGQGDREVVVRAVANRDVGVASLLEEHLIGDPSFALEDLHCLVGCSVVKEGFTENVGVKSSGDLLDFCEEGRVHIQSDFLRVFMRFRRVYFDIDDVLSLNEVLEECEA